jgi:dolichol-phosphate mannosyltransferase
MHFAVAFALTAPLLGARRAALAGAIALTPDLDALLHVHRSMTHSAMTLLALALPIAYLAHRGGVKWRASALMIAALMSHPILDTFQTYTPILYPILGSTLIEFKAGVIIGNGLNPYVDASVHVRQADFTPFTSLDGPILAGESLLASLTLILAPLLFSLARPSRQRRAAGEASLKPPSAPQAGPDPPSPATEVSPSDVTIVIPTLNEAESIGTVLDELRREGYLNVLVVDGYSSDGTAEVARRKGASVVLQHGSGKSGALKTALEHVSTPYVLVMDGDHTYDPRDIKRLLAHAAKYDEVIGARANTENIPWLHRLGNRAINLAFNLLLGARLSDVCSGMYLVRTEALRGVELGRGFSAEVEVAAHVFSHGRVTEVPVSYRRRVGRRKLKTFRDGLRIMYEVVQLARTYNPVFLFSTLASALAVPGAALTLWQLYLRYTHGAGAWSLGAAWLGLILLIVGLQGFTAATISLMLKRMERRIVQSLEGRLGGGRGA